MKPAWDQLATRFADSPFVVIAEVDCTGAGQALCNTNQVKGYPTIKWGKPEDMKLYEGHRDLEAMSTFFIKNGLACGPRKLDMCAQERREELERMMDLDDDAINRDIGLTEAQIKDANRKLESLKAVVAMRGPVQTQKDAGISGEPEAPESKTMATNREEPFNPIVYLRHFALYVLAPIVALVWISVLFLPLIYRRKQWKRSIAKDD